MLKPIKLFPLKPITVRGSVDRIRAHKLVESVSDERGCDQGIWAYLKPGWRFEDTHIVHEDTITQVLARLKEAEPCACMDCRKARPDHQSRKEHS